MSKLHIDSELDREYILSSKEKQYNYINLWSNHEYTKKKLLSNERMYYVTIHNEEWYCKSGIEPLHYLNPSNSMDLNTSIFFITCYKFIKIYLTI